MLPITVCIMTYNEEDLIETAINSVISIVNEVVVLDTGSTDKTIQKAISLGAKVYDSVWEGDFSRIRNKMISLARGQFILMMDADEQYLGAEKELKEYIKQSDGCAGRVKIINDLGNEETTISSVTRIFPNHSGFFYNGFIHEQLMNEKNKIKYIPTSITFNHVGYKKELIKKKDKTQRNVELLKRQLSTGDFDPYIYYQLGRTYYVGAQYRDAVDAFIQAYNWIEANNDSPIYESSLFLQLGYSLMKLGSWGEFDYFFQKAIQKYSDYTDLYFMYGVSIIEGRRVNLFQEIPKFFEICLDLGDPPAEVYETVIGVGSFKSLYNLGLFYEITGAKEKARYYYDLSSKLGSSEATHRRNQLL